MENLTLLLKVLKITTALLSLLGIVFAILAMTLKKCKHRDRYWYFGARLIVGSIIELLITFALSYGLH